MRSEALNNCFNVNGKLVALKEILASVEANCAARLESINSTEYTFHDNSTVTVSVDAILLSGNESFTVTDLCTGKELKVITDSPAATKLYITKRSTAFKEAHAAAYASELVADIDQGAHYRFEYRQAITPEDTARGYVIVKLDPFRIAAIYGMTCFALQTILKKVLCAGNRGHNSEREDLLDIRNAIDRKLEMLDEDERNEPKFLV